MTQSKFSFLLISIPLLPVATQKLHCPRLPHSLDKPVWIIFLLIPSLFPYFDHFIPVIISCGHMQQLTQKYVSFLDVKVIFQNLKADWLPFHKKRYPQLFLGYSRMMMMMIIVALFFHLAYYKTKLLIITSPGCAKLSFKLASKGFGNESIFPLKPL